MIQTGIASIGTAVPEKILTNQELEKMVETSDEWITTRTGIKERHVLQGTEKIADYTTIAGKIACERAKVAPEKLDFVISSTISPDRISPAQSFEVAHNLQSNQAFCFDVNAACSGFIYGLALADSLLKTRDISFGLVTAGEQITRMTDYTDRNSCVLFGDAASAAVVTKINPEHLLLHTELGSVPSMSEEVIIGGIKDLLDGRKSDYYFRQNGKVVFKFAVNTIKNVMETVPAKVGLKPEQIKYVIPHQANSRILDAAMDNAAGNAEFINVIDRYGNTSSASIGLGLDFAWNRFKKGDFVMLIGFGGGLSWGAALIEW
jgi:3-oxoacyl-[acyl-carrier-protein] synthase-3